VAIVVSPCARTRARAPDASSSGPRSAEIINAAFTSSGFVRAPRAAAARRSRHSTSPGPRIRRLSSRTMIRGCVCCANQRLDGGAEGVWAAFCRRMVPRRPPPRCWSLASAPRKCIKKLPVAIIWGRKTASQKNIPPGPHPNARALSKIPHFYKQHFFPFHNPQMPPGSTFPPGKSPRGQPSYKKKAVS